MKWSTKGINIIKSIGVQVVIPAPMDNELSKIKPDVEYTVEIKNKSKRRSISANNFCWTLCQRIAKELSKNGYIGKEDVYRKAILDSQQGDPVGVPNNRLDSFVRKWQSNGIGWICVIDDNERLSGVKRVYLYAGSSTYNTAEMSRLIECLVDECNQLGVTIEPTAYINSLLKEWGDNN